MPALTLIIPVPNEAQHLRTVLPRIRVAVRPSDRQWIIVDDRPIELLEAWVAEQSDEKAGMRLLVRSQSAPGLKGIAEAEAIAEATGGFTTVQDAHLDYDPAHSLQLFVPLVEGRAHVVCGSRFRRDGTQVHRTFRYLINRVLTALSNLASGIYLSDMETCYKLFRTDLLQAMRLRSHLFGVEIELTANVAKTRARIR